ncbi:MAG TPA: sigma 54-interacting transcriptional regulator [Syntrophorhabdaceae bacterium]|nr:sigma 54-interacting transcriptional regulator [Syntrophorhabdaceae bacterium]
MKLSDVSETIQNEIMLYLQHTPSPMAIDTLIALSGCSVIDVLNVLEGLRKKKIVYERDGHRKGVYFAEKAKLLELTKKSVSDEKRKYILKKIIDFYMRSDADGDQSSLILAPLFLELQSIGEGITHIRQAADRLNISGQIEQAARYYDSILKYFDSQPLTSVDVEDYLKAILGKIEVGYIAMPIAERLSILTNAEAVAKKYKKWTYLMRIKLELGQAYRLAGEPKKASRFVANFWKITSRSTDKSILKTAALMTSNYYLFRGHISEVVRRYDEIVGSLEEFGNSERALMQGALIGYSYVLNGRVARGIGMIDAIRTKANLLNLPHVLALTDCISAQCFLEIRRIDEAAFYADRALANGVERLGLYIMQSLDSCNAFILTTKQDFAGAFEHVKAIFERQLIAEQAFGKQGYAFEYLDILESKGFRHEFLNFDDEIERLINSESPYNKGIAYRYRALRNSERHVALSTVLDDLRKSEICLMRSGAEIELARTRIALANHYLMKGRSKHAQSYFEMASARISKIDPDLFPKDILSVLPQDRKIEAMAERIISINEGLARDRNISSFLEEVINTAMDYSMATRGAFFSIEQGRPTVLASRSLDPAFLDTSQFAAIRQIATHVVTYGKRIDSQDIADNYPVSKDALREADITSFACIPAILNGHTYGCLYLDNRLGQEGVTSDQSAFMKILCNQVAIGLSNISIFNEVSEMRDRYEEEAIFYKRQMGVQVPLDTIMGDSKAVETVKDRIRRVAGTDSSVLISGETGVGKELVAKAVHNLSTRKDGPFIPVNIAALPHDLVASELFGHEKGAFTGASEKQKGRFELADGGTIFLDEIGDLPMDVQAKLLRVLQEGTFERLGSAKSIHSNFRVITATNKDLRIEAEEGRFRSDLYYRLNVFHIFVPPLRERKEDIPLLARYFLEKFERKIGKKTGRIHSRDMKSLVDCDWPGNVRELEHAIEKAVILSDGQSLTFPDLERAPVQRLADQTSSVKTLAEIEREYIVRILESKRWRISGPKGAAVSLGLAPQTLYSRMKKLGIERESEIAG